MQLAVMDSSTEMQEVRVAKMAVTKNRMPTNTPALPMALNTLGSETNIRLGPALMPSVPEKTYTAGMIMAPASRGYAGIEDLNLIHRFVQVYFRFDVGTVGDHNAHGHAEEKNSWLMASSRICRKRCTVSPQGQASGSKEIPVSRCEADRKHPYVKS